MRVIVLPRAAIIDGAAEGADAVVSIRGAALSAADEANLDLAVTQAVAGDVEAVLRLRFDDVGLERFALDERAVLKGPTFEDVQNVIEFGRRVRAERADVSVVSHCEQGRSRSTAVALAILADAFGPGREEEAVAALMREDLDGMFHPNPRFVRMSDVALLRADRLESALIEACPRYLHWADFWKGVAAGDAAAVEKVHLVLGFGRRQRRRKR